MCTHQLVCKRNTLYSIKVELMIKGIVPTLIHIGSQENLVLTTLC